VPSGKGGPAGRSLPLDVSVATVFATWFGSETVLEIPARFLEGGLGAAVTTMLGSIPLQDVFQRVTSARTAKVATWER
jgi:hypothetical protein